MKKSILVVLAIVSVLAFVTGCSVVTSRTSSSAVLVSFKTSRSANISPRWILKDVEIKLGAGKELPILFKLSDGDQVDGEFYLEEGKNVNFSIADSVVFYKPAGATGVTTSDRFSFIASKGQGIAYTLTFRNPAGDSEKNNNITVFMHLTYPDTASVFIPVDTKQN